ncbi:DUF3113 family protein, partial [Staphylococcus aureus]
RNYTSVDNEKEALADYLYNNPDELLNYDSITIRHAYIEVE